MRKGNLLALCMGLVVLCGGVSVGGVVTDFGAGGQDNQLASENAGWSKGRHGKPGGCVIREEVTPWGKARVMASPGAGDYWNNWKPDSAAWSESTRGPVVVFTVKFKAVKGGGAKLFVPLGGADSTQFRSGLCLGLFGTGDITVATKSSKGLLAFTPDHWYEALFIIADSNEPDRAKGTFAFRDVTAGEEVFSIDPALNAIEMDLNALVAQPKPDVQVRLDNKYIMSALAAESFATRDALPKMKVVETEAGFAPLLDHLTASRQAVDLGGAWKLASSSIDGKIPEATANWQAVKVPDKHASLMKGKDKKYWFKRSFDVKEVKPGSRYLVHFERVDDVSEIYVNGKEVGRSTNGWYPFTVDVTDAIKVGENELAVGVLTPSASNAVGNRPVGWSWFLPLFSGIPFPVHMEIVNSVYIEKVFVETLLAGGSRIRTEVVVRNESEQEREISIEANAGGDFTHTPVRGVVSPKSAKSFVLEDKWSDPHLWRPGDPYLYKLSVRLKEEAKLDDAYNLRFGFREVRVEGPRLLLNGRPFIHRRNSIICYYDWHRDAKLRSSFELLRSRGYVGSRLHGPGNERIARIADEMGWLLTVESGINEPRGDAMNDAFWPAAEDHVLRLVEHFRNHPSVIYWSLSNEFASNYMHTSDAAKLKWVDNWMMDLGRKVMTIDPTRTVAYSGDISLGGRGKDGPAPTISLHYAWQPAKPVNMIPNTSYWLEEGLRPWQGIKWDQKKPIMLSEDLYPPYAFNPPNGMSQWAGDGPYDPAFLGQATFQAYRMLAEGYYHAGVSVWNPWGTAETDIDNPIYKSGPLMPDYLIATRENNSTFESGEQVARTLYIENEWFEDLSVTLASDFPGSSSNNVANEQFMLKAGEVREEKRTLQMPTVDKVTPIQWTLIAKDSKNSEITRRTYSYTIFPKSGGRSNWGEVVVVVAEDRKVAGELVPGAKFIQNVDEALKLSPRVLVLLGATADKRQLDLLEAKVRDGMSVLWVNVKQGSVLPSPLKMDAGHKAAFAFIRTANNPIFAGFSDVSLSSWRTNGLVVQDALFKPSKGVYDILVDCGSPEGLSRVAILRLNRGKGCFLFCQMSVLDNVQDPAARAVTSRLAASLVDRKEEARYPIVLSAPQDSKLRSALRMMDIPFGEMDSAQPGQGLWVIDASYAATADDTNRLAKHVAAGGRAILQRLTPQTSAAWLGALSAQGKVNPVAVDQVVRHATTPLLDGLTNYDFYWKLNAKAGGPSILSHAMELTGEKSLVEPAALIAPSAYKDRVLISQVRWDDLYPSFPDKAGRIARTLLRNMNGDLGDGNVRRKFYKPVALAMTFNAGWEDDGASAGGRGWFREKPDMTYFPVNRTGIDPVLGVPQPPVAFEDTLRSDDVVFKLQDPKNNKGLAAIVVGAKERGFATEVVIPMAEKQFESLWLAGAGSKASTPGAKIAVVDFVYGDGKTASVEMAMNREVGAFTALSTLERGRVLWTGSGGGKSRVQIYAWAIANPRPNADVKEIILRSTSPDVALGLVAITTESAEKESKK